MGGFHVRAVVSSQARCCSVLQRHVGEFACQLTGGSHVRAMANSAARCCLVLPRQYGDVFLCGLRRKLASEIRSQSAPFKMRVWIVARTSSTRESSSRPPAAMSQNRAARLRCNKATSLVGSIGAAFFREKIVSTWETKCESRQQEDAKQRPVFVSC